MKRILFLMIFIFTFEGFIKAQEAQTPPKDKKKIELRPNSREYGAVRRDNFHRRMVIKKDKAMILKKRSEMQRLRMMQMKKKRAFKQEQMVRKSQAIQRRRAIRK